VRLCRGRDCAARRAEIEALKESLPACASIETVKCQDICAGPVAVIRRGKHKFWFKKLRGAELLTDLATFIEEGSISAALVAVLDKKK
jgi:hypothetical protein